MRIGPVTGHHSDRDNWAPPIARLTAPPAPRYAQNLNLDGRRPMGVLQGFGQLWRKTYRISLPHEAVLPQDVIRVWKCRFESFWPEGSQFFKPLTELSPGDVALINMHVLPGPLQLSTGIVVMYADDECFSFMTPEGHMFAGWITFSAVREGTTVVAQVEALIRTSDPLWEIVMRAFGAYGMEDRFWAATLRALALSFGVADARFEMRAECLDRRLQWSKAPNIWRNAALWSTLYLLAAPLRLAAERVYGSGPDSAHVRHRSAMLPGHVSVKGGDSAGRSQMS